MIEREVSKSCDSCSMKMTAMIPSEDKDIFNQLCSMFKKQVKCQNCSEFEEKIGRVNDLKKDAWTKIKSIEAKKGRLEDAIQKGWVEPNSSEWLAKWKKQESELRDKIVKIEFKERAILGKYGLHMKKEKEKNGIQH